MTSFKTSASASSSVSSGVVVVSHPVGSMGEVWHSQVHTFILTTFYSVPGCYLKDINLFIYSEDHPFWMKTP